MKFLYNIGIKAYGIGILYGALLHSKKAKQWIAGRLQWQKKLEAIKVQKPIWIHVSSLGEFIMAKPLIEHLLDSYKDKKILLTFFSPSGFLNTTIDHKRIIKHYLPLDTPSNAQKFIQLTNPCIAIFAKYDLWFNYLLELQKKSIPTIVFSAHLKSNQLYFKKGFKWQKKILQNFSKILVINKNVQQYLKNEGFTNTLVCGDTRFDQVGINSEENLSDIIEFINNRTCIVIGSSWNREEKLIQKVYAKISGFAIIVAPHNISENRILEIEKTFQNNTIRLSKIKENNKSNPILIIDSIGLLSQIYQLSDIALVGGGFSGKLHNILEPASTNNVVLFGHNYNNYPEAEELISKKGAFSVKNEKDLATLFEIIKDVNQMKCYKEKALDFVIKNKGATKIILNEIKKLI